MIAMDYQANLLVIDDEPDNFDVIETLLHQENYRLSYASSAVRALERMESINPDVILLDIMMPEMNGIEFCQQLRLTQRWQKVPVIVVTALTAKEDIAYCLRAGADDFISKPVNGIELSARVRSMLRIKRHYDHLQNTLQLREDLSNMIVHDLRNPLASIFISTEMLRLSGLKSTSQEQKVERIVAASHQLQSLIDNLLLMAKMEAGKLLLQETDVDLSAICMSAIADIEMIAAQKKLELISDLPPIGGSHRVDIAIFRRVIDNLLSNAVKFSPTSSQITMRLQYLPTGEAKIQVVDEGPGIPPVVRTSIFEKYEIGTLMKNVTQIGLGLAFCKMAIEAHGGRISVSDNYPKGAIFTIEI